MPFDNALHFLPGGRGNFDKRVGSGFGVTKGAVLNKLLIIIVSYFMIYQAGSAKYSDTEPGW